MTWSSISLLSSILRRARYLFLLLPTLLLVSSIDSSFPHINTGGNHHVPVQGQTESVARTSEVQSQSGAESYSAMQSVPEAQLTATTRTPTAESFKTPYAELHRNEFGVARSEQFPPLGAALDRGREANIAFFLQLTESSLVLAVRLIKKLWHKGNVIIVHIDLKAPDSVVAPFKRRFDAAQYSNVYFLPRVSITYAGVSMLLNTLSAMEFALNLEKSWDYFINLSGSDYPLVSTENMRVILGQPRILNQQVSFVQMSTNDDILGDIQDTRFNFHWDDPSLWLKPGTIGDDGGVALRKVVRVRGKSTHTYDFKFMHAEAWIMAHRTMALEAVRGAFARRLLVSLATSKDPEEHFWPMLAWNLPHLNRSLAHHAGRGIVWVFDGQRSGQHPFVVDEFKNGVYRFWDLINIQYGAIFMRKFTIPNSGLMEKIDKTLSGAHPQPNEVEVRKKLERTAFALLCRAAVEKQYYGRVYCR